MTNSTSNSDLDSLAMATASMLCVHYEALIDEMNSVKHRFFNSVSPSNRQLSEEKFAMLDVIRSLHLALRHSKEERDTLKNSLGYPQQPTTGSTTAQSSHRSILVTRSKDTATMTDADPNLEALRFDVEKKQKQLAEHESRRLQLEEKLCHIQEAQLEPLQLRKIKLTKKKCRLLEMQNENESEKENLMKESSVLLDEIQSLRTQIQVQEGNHQRVAKDHRVFMQRQVHSSCRHPSEVTLLPSSSSLVTRTNNSRKEDQDMGEGTKSGMTNEGDDSIVDAHSSKKKIIKIEELDQKIFQMQDAIAHMKSRNEVELAAFIIAMKQAEADLEETIRQQPHEETLRAAAAFFGIQQHHPSQEREDLVVGGPSSSTTMVACHNNWSNNASSLSLHHMHRQLVVTHQDNTISPSQTPRGSTSSYQKFRVIESPLPSKILHPFRRFQKKREHEEQRNALEAQHVQELRSKIHGISNEVKWYHHQKILLSALVHSGKLSWYKLSEIVGRDLPPAALDIFDADDED